MNKQEHSKIEYLDYTWGPISGCLHACPYCYMERMAARFHQLSMVPAFHPKRLEEPLRVKKSARIGVTFNGDMWGEWVAKAEIEQVLSVCREAHWHRFVFLTKNPARYAEFDIPENCWCGTSVTGGDDDDGRPLKLVCAASQAGFRDRTFLSIEPFTGNAGTDCTWFPWVIIGGLTGKGACKPDPKIIQWIVDFRKPMPTFVKSNAGVGPQEYPEGLKIWNTTRTTALSR